MQKPARTAICPGGFFCGWTRLTSTFFYSWWSGLFTGPFEKKRVSNVVFRWSLCGEMRGKRGELMHAFSRSKTRQLF
jgi:hypothetical protein